MTDDPQIDASNMEVTVKDREVTLTGSVDSREAKRRAEDLAESISGVKDVHNSLRLTAGQQGAGAGQQGTTCEGATCPASQAGAEHGLPAPSQPGTEGQDGLPGGDVTLPQDHGVHGLHRVLRREV